MNNTALSKTESVIWAMNTAFDSYQELQELCEMKNNDNDVLVESHKNFLGRIETEYRQKVKSLVNNEEIESNSWDFFLMGDDKKLTDYLNSYFGEN